MPTLPPLPTMSLPNISLAFLINKPTLIAVFIIAVMLHILVTSVLLYHWSRYGMGGSGVAVAKILYLFVSVILLVSAVLSISYF